MKNSRSKFVVTGPEENQKRTYFGFISIDSLTRKVRRELTKYIIVIAYVEDSHELWRLDDEDSLEDLKQYYRECNEIQPSLLVMCNPLMLFEKRKQKKRKW